MKKRILAIVIAIVMAVGVGVIFAACPDLDEYTLTLSPATVNLTDTNLSAIVTIGGTATGVITLDQANLPAGITATIEGTMITVAGTRPTTAGAATIVADAVVVPVTRAGVTTNLTVNANLTTAYVTNGGGDNGNGGDEDEPNIWDVIEDVINDIIDGILENVEDAVVWLENILEEQFGISLQDFVYENFELTVEEAVELLITWLEAIQQGVATPQ